MLPGLPDDDELGLDSLRLSNSLPTLPKGRMGLLSQTKGPQMEKANFLPKSVMLQPGLFHSAKQKSLLY